jgi:hypothetical protein
MPSFKPTLSSATLVPAATAFADLDVRGFDRAVLIGQVGNGATAQADLTLFTYVFATDGAIVTGPTVTPVRTSAALQGNVALAIHQVDLSGLEKLRVNLRNNHATLTLTPVLDVFLVKNKNLR